MTTKTTIFGFVLSVSLLWSHALADSVSTREYQIKAAFLYNFIMFVDWPKDKLPDNSEPIVIGIIGKDPFMDAFEPVKDDLVKGRKITILRFKGIEELKASGSAGLDTTRDAVRKCHLLFICQSEDKTLKDILDMVRDSSVLTVADMPGFLAAGGMINLFVEDTKTRFEINNVVTSRAGLKIGSQLLRLAKKVI